MPDRDAVTDSVRRQFADSQVTVGVTSQGKAYGLARNEYNSSEFCGSAFSAAGNTLFVNIQSPGFTLAITGPWGRPATPTCE